MLNIIKEFMELINRNIECFEYWGTLALVYYFSFSLLTFSCSLSLSLFMVLFMCTIHNIVHLYLLLYFSQLMDKFNLSFLLPLLQP